MTEEISTETMTILPNSEEDATTESNFQNIQSRGWCIKFATGPKIDHS